MSAGLMTKGRMSMVRASVLRRPAFCKSKAALSAITSVSNTSTVMKTPVTRRASKNSGSSVSKLM